MTTALLIVFGGTAVVAGLAYLAGRLDNRLRATRAPSAAPALKRAERDLRRREHLPFFNNPWSH